MNIPDIRQSAKNLFISVPLSPVTSALCVVGTAIGLVASAASIITGGAFGAINRFADRLTASRGILAAPYQAVISVLNTKQEYSSYKAGVVTSKTAGRMTQLAQRLIHSEKPVVRELGSRAIHALAAVTYTVSKVCDLAIGVFAGAASLLLLGQADRVNDFANRHLMSTGVVYDVSRSLRGIVNPHQFQVPSRLADIH